MQKICIVIPCYNESKRLPLKIFETYIGDNEINFCFVDDGSNDSTYQILLSLHEKFSDKVQVIKNNPNLGKAESVRKGINSSLKWKEFDYLGFFDADLSTPLDEINHIMQYFGVNRKFKFALGSRWNRLGSRIERNPIRHYLSRIFATLVSTVLNLPVYDSQCGAKIMYAEIADKIFKEPFISKWLFDIELLARVQIYFSPDILVEVPLNNWKDLGKTKIKFLDTLKFPTALFRIKMKYKMAAK